LIRPCSNLLFDLQPHGFEIESHLPQHGDGGALSKPDQPQEEMFCADEVVVEALGFPAR